MGQGSLEQRLAPYTAVPRRPSPRAAFRRARIGALRPRLDDMLERTVARFELDRLLYEIEVDAQDAWLRNLVAFDAFCAGRDAPGGGPPAPPVR
jgi:hypothetical protein